MNKPYWFKKRQYAACISAFLIAVPLTMTAAAVHAATGSSNETTDATLTFRDNNLHSRVIEKRGDVAIVEDDMIVGTANEFFDGDRSVRGLGNTVYGRTWPNGIVPFQFADDLTTANRAKVIAAIAHWNDNSDILLVERTNANAAEHANYLYFINASQCASWVGFQGTGSQDVYVGSTCTTGSMIHEIGHGLGLLHEHTRPDRDAYVSINWGNVINGKEHNFDILSDGAVPLGEYDYGSIMHYGTHFFSSNNSATLSATQATDATIGQREATSVGDREAIAKLYETDLSLAAQAASAQVAAGDPIELNMAVTNNSTNGANTLAVTLPATAGLALLEASSALWQCSQAVTGADIVCAVDEINASQSSNLSLTVSSAELSGEVTLVPSLTSRTQDSVASNNTDAISVTVINGDDSGIASGSQQPDSSSTDSSGSDAADAGANEEANSIADSDADSSDAASDPQVETLTEPAIAAANSGNEEAGAGAGNMGASLLLFSGLLALRRRR